MRNPTAYRLRLPRRGRLSAPRNDNKKGKRSMKGMAPEKSHPIFCRRFHSICRQRICRGAPLRSCPNLLRCCQNLDFGYSTHALADLANNSHATALHRRRLLYSVGISGWYALTSYCGSSSPRHAGRVGVPFVCDWLSATVVLPRQGVGSRSASVEESRRFRRDEQCSSAWQNMVFLSRAPDSENARHSRYVMNAVPYGEIDLLRDWWHYTVECFGRSKPLPYKSLRKELCNDP